MRKLTIALSLLTLVASMSCLSTRRRRQGAAADVKSVTADISRSRPEIDEDRLGEFFFDLYWDSYIDNEIISAVTCQGRHLYAFTLSNRLYQIDMQSGKVNWLFETGAPLDFAEAENPIHAYYYSAETKKDFQLYDELFLIAGDTLFALDLENGSELWRKELPFPSSAPPVATDSHVYVGGWDDRLHAINKQDQQIDWFYRTDGDIRARGAAQRDSVYCVSTDGRGLRLAGGSGDVIWPFRTGRDITTDPLLNLSSKLLYLPSNDFTLYGINIDAGNLEWSYETGGPIKRQPVEIGPYLYCFSQVQTFQQTKIKKTPTLLAWERKGRNAFQKTQHDFLWDRESPYRFLAAGAEDLYVLETSTNEKQRIAKLDQKKGFLRDVLEVEGVDFFVENRFTQAGEREDKFLASIIFMGYRNGWIFAIKERPRRR